MSSSVPRTGEKSKASVQEAFVFPASFAQRRLWFLHQIDQDSSVYNITAHSKITGPIDVVALERSFQEIVRRHETLRTTFSALDSEPLQVVSLSSRFNLALLDLQSLSPSVQHREMLNLARAESSCPFSLSQGPLLRASLLRLNLDLHFLLLTMHHIISDGWSLGVLWRETSTLYRSFCEGLPSPLPDLPIQYADFAQWQRQWLEGDLLKAQLSYWSRQLDALPPALEIPTDFQRPAIRSYRGSLVSLSIDRDLSDRLHVFNQKHRATMYMTLLAAFQVLLYRYSRQDDIAIGSPIAGRTRTETEGLIGFFVNTLVMRTNLSGAPEFRELLARVKEVTLGAYGNQDVPFERLVEVLSPQRSLNRTPLFQVMFALQNSPLPQMEFGEARLEPINVSSGTSKFDITMSLEETGGTIEGYLEYSTELFEHQTIQRMIGHYKVLLENLLADDQSRIDYLPLLTEAERNHLLAEWSGANRPLQSEKLLHELFEEFAERMPDATAVASSEGRLKYSELNSQANRLAAYLRGLGIGPEVPVGVLLEPSIEMVIGVLGILKAGGGYVPIDPSFPMDRIEFILEDSGVTVLLTCLEMKECIAACGINVVCMDEDMTWLSSYSDANVPRNSMIENQAYTIYTSGSTGRPKGVVVEQRQILNYLNAILDRFDLAPGAQYAMLQPLAVDSCNTVFIPSLCGGGTLHVMPHDQAADPYAVLEYFLHNRIEVLKMAPSHLAALLEACPTTELLPHDVLALGGEGSHWDWVRNTLEDLAPPASRIFIHYGPTETTVGIMTNHIRSDATQRGTLVPLGHSLPNTRVYVLDDVMEPVPIGVAGEIFIGGDCVARGYLNRPELTAERFMPDPYGNTPGARLYRTGDLARWLPEGEVEFLGRTDYQVKIRGFRIELNEIDAMLNKHPAVEKAVTIARENGAAGKQLVAYVAPKRTDQGSNHKTALDAKHLARRLRDFLKEKLPGYMVPSNLVVLESIPLSPQGKVNLRALPDPSMEMMQHDCMELPRTLLQAQLIEIWEEVLKVSPIGIADDFFEIGGHSLLAVRMITMIRRRLKRTIPLASLFRNPTVASLAKVLAQSSDGSSSSGVLVEIQPEGDGLPFFCVHPVGGSVFCYADLARALGRDRPFYGLQAPEPGAFSEDGLHESGTTIEQIAALYIPEIRRIRSVGPYLLGGWSMGGLLAFEMARQLSQQGEKVAMLVLFDTHVPPLNREAIEQRDELPVLVRFAADMNRLIGKDQPDLQETFCSLTPGEQRAMLLDAIKRDGVLAGDATEKEMDAHLSVFTRNAMAVDRYSLQPCGQPIVLFRALSAPEQLAEQWSRWTSAGVEQYPTPGDHYSMLRRPNVGWLAERLKSCLELFEREQVD